MNIVSFENLPTSDLIIDGIYLGGGINRNIKDDPINRILPVGNSGGFRPVNVNTKNKLPNQFALYSDGYHEDWPETRIGCSMMVNAYPLPVITNFYKQLLHRRQRLGL